MTNTRRKNVVIKRLFNTVHNLSTIRGIASIKIWETSAEYSLDKRLIIHRDEDSDLKDILQNAGFEIKYSDKGLSTNLGCKLSDANLNYHFRNHDELTVQFAVDKVKSLFDGRDSDDFNNYHVVNADRHVTSLENSSGENTYEFYIDKCVYKIPNERMMSLLESDRADARSDSSLGVLRKKIYLSELLTMSDIIQNII